MQGCWPGAEWGRKSVEGAARGDGGELGEEGQGRWNLLLGSCSLPGSTWPGRGDLRQPPRGLRVCLRPHLKKQKRKRNLTDALYLAKNETIVSTHDHYRKQVLYIFLLWIWGGLVLSPHVATGCSVARKSRTASFPKRGCAHARTQARKDPALDSRASEVFAFFLFFHIPTLYEDASCLEGKKCPQIDSPRLCLCGNAM